MRSNSAIMKIQLYLKLQHDFLPQEPVSPDVFCSFLRLSKYSSAPHLHFHFFGRFLIFLHFLNQTYVDFIYFYIFMRAICNEKGIVSCDLWINSKELFDVEQLDPLDVLRLQNVLAFF